MTRQRIFLVDSVFQNSLGGLKHQSTEVLEVKTKMIVYKVFYIHRKVEPMRGEFIGGLIERRKVLRGRSRVDSGLAWARLTFSHLVKDKHSIFIVPDELYLKYDTILPVGKKMFNREEFLWMMEAVDLRIKKKGEGTHRSSALIN